jgi:hypothetical protein
MAPKSLECQPNVKGFKMNERIRELAEQAVEQVCSKRTLSDGQIERVWHPDHFNQVFAELIVRECCEQLVKEGESWEQFSRNPPEGQETNTGAALFAAYRLKEDAVSRLEEHFGVE